MTGTCSICLGDIKGQSFPDVCEHNFCFTCLKRWSKIKNFCPLCKQVFKRIYNSYILYSLIVFFEVFQYIVKSDTLKKYPIKTEARGEARETETVDRIFPDLVIRSQSDWRHLSDARLRWRVRAERVVSPQALETSIRTPIRLTFRFNLD